jgi:hypothetical protein
MDRFVNKSPPSITGNSLARPLTLKSAGRTLAQTFCAMLVDIIHETHSSLCSPHQSDGNKTCVDLVKHTVPQFISKRSETLVMKIPIHCARHPPPPSLGGEKEDRLL